MNNKSYKLFKESIFWEHQWEEKADKYLQGKPTLGIVIEELISNKVLSNVQTICEIAAGSARDSLYLAKRFSVVATDKFPAGFQLAKEIARIEKRNILFKKEDALNFSFPDNHFDLVFHNGFFILFLDNKEIIKLFREQMRIAKKYIMIVVHNKFDLYSRLRMKYFSGKEDALYKFRWWSMVELKRLVKAYGKIVKTGGLEINLLVDIKNYRLIPSFIRNMKIWDWEGWKKTLPSERIFIIIEKKNYETKKV